MKIYTKHYDGLKQTYTFTEAENGNYYCTSHEVNLSQEITEQDLIEAGYQEFHVK